MAQEDLGLVPADYPELFFGLVGAVGTDLKRVFDTLSEALQSVGYRATLVKATSLLQDLSRFQNVLSVEFASDGDRTHKFMDAGNDLRRLTERKDIMAMLCIAEIRKKRRILNSHSPVNDDDRRPVAKMAYIIYSLKTPQEVDLLRAVYGQAFFVISAYSPRERRLERLAQKYRSEHQAGDVEEYLESARKLIKRDEKETDSFGQNVRGCFPRGDVFVDASDVERLRAGINRFVELLFGNLFITPTKDEFSMFHAYSAALRSADLGRQVGAVIASEDGNVIAVGCNEVPKADGGLYWEGDDPDQRDFVIGHDSSDENKKEILFELISILRKEGWLNPKKIRNRKTKQVTKELLDPENSVTLRGSRLMSLIEFGRAVHAEMAALMDAARRGIRVSHSTLYCTTFPCHLCARHIIAAGINRVVYVEPYPKSQAAAMYRDSMVVDCDGLRPGFVNFQPFVGIAPRFYDFAFKMTADRKSASTGEALLWKRHNARPKVDIFSRAYVLREENVIGYDLKKSLKRAKISAN